MRPLLFIALILFFATCRQKTSMQNLAIEKLKYSAFYWTYNDSANSREFYLDHYIEIDKEGKYKLMRQDEWKSKPKYFNGVITHTLRMLMDSILFDKVYNSNYSINVDSPVMYHGLTYCFDYTNTSKKILFIPPYSPHQFKILGGILDTFIMRANVTSTDTLLLDYYKSVLAKLDSPNLPPLPVPPPPPNKNQSKFRLTIIYWGLLMGVSFI